MRVTITALTTSASPRGECLPSVGAGDLSRTHKQGLQKAKDYVPTTITSPADEYHPEMDFRSDAVIARFGAALMPPTRRMKRMEVGDEFDKIHASGREDSLNIWRPVIHLKIRRKSRTRQRPVLTMNFLLSYLIFCPSAGLPPSMNPASLLFASISLAGGAGSSTRSKSIDVPAGKVEVQSIDGDGKQKVITENMKLPPDLANGLLILLKTFRAPAQRRKPRDCHHTQATAGEAGDFADREDLQLGTEKRQATHYVVKIEWGGHRIGSVRDREATTGFHGWIRR